MIVQHDGRSRTVRTRKEIEQRIKAELDAATPAERETLSQLIEGILAEPVAPGQPPPESLYEKLMDLEYHTRPVDIETFCKDPYYLGETCANTYPVWLEDMKELFNGGYRELVLTGSIGVGKSFVASIVCLYVLYEISCMRDPHRSFGLSPGSDISAVVFSVTEDLAIKVIFENVATKVAASRYFQEKFYPNVLKKEVRFPNNVRIAPKAANDTSALGMNVIMAIIDESNFLNRSKRRKIVDPSQGGVDRAEVIYNSLKRRMISRYQQRGRLPGMFVIASSKQSKTDFTERLIKQAQKEQDAGIFVRDYALWDMKPANYSPKKFWVLCGTDQLPSRILTDAEADRLKNDPNLPDGAVIIPVPEDLRDPFQKDLEGSIKDLAGISVSSNSPFFKQRGKIYAAMDNSRKHPFTTELYDMGNPGQFIWSELVKGGGRRGSADVPIHYPTALRHIHMDLSQKKDSTGLTMGCISGWTTVERVAPDGRQYAEHAPVYHIDFMLEVRPPMGGEIDQGSIIALVRDLSAHGMPIASISADRWQSAFILQSLAQQGYTTEVVSVDVTMEPYETLRWALYEDRLKMYPYAPVVEELKSVEVDWTRMKIDHPIGGKKDVADSLAGVVFALAKNKYSRPVLPIRSGSTTPDESEWLSDPSLLGDPNFLRMTKGASGFPVLPGSMELPFDPMAEPLGQPRVKPPGVPTATSVPTATHSTIPGYTQPAATYMSPSQLMFGNHTQNGHTPQAYEDDFEY